MKLLKFKIELTEVEEYEQSEKHVFVKVCLDLNEIKTPVYSKSLFLRKRTTLPDRVRISASSGSPTGSASSSGSFKFSSGFALGFLLRFEFRFTFFTRK